MRHQAIVLLAAFALGTSASAGTQGFQVVVNSSVKGTWISRASLEALFTGKTNRWGDKETARPVDQSAKASVRHAFTESVLGLSMGEVQRYWQNRVAADRVFPPPIKDSDEEVLAFVARTSGAVGYVGPGTAIPDGVRVIDVVD